MRAGMDACVQTVAPAEQPLAEWASALIHARCTVLPRRLLAPGPDRGQLEAILGAAAAAPDHGELVPWRFVLVPERSRAALAAMFETSLLDLHSMGVDAVRISPQAQHTERMIAVFDAGRRRNVAPREALERSGPLMPAAGCNGYWHSRPGLEQVPAAAAA